MPTELQIMSFIHPYQFNQNGGRREGIAEDFPHRTRRVEPEILPNAGIAFAVSPQNAPDHAACRHTRLRAAAVCCGIVPGQCFCRTSKKLSEPSLAQLLLSVGPRRDPAAENPDGRLHP